MKQRHLVRIIVLLTAILYASHGATKSVQSYERLTFTQSFPAPGLVKTVMRYQVLTVDEQGQLTRDPLNQFNVVRLKKMQGPIAGPVLLRSPFNYDSRYYEIATHPNSYETTLLGALAREGFDVWSVDDRVNSFPPGACESGELDCSIMGTWDLHTKAKDIDFVRQQILREYPRQKPVLGGLVGGGMDAMVALNHHPDAYAGFFSWQGTLHADDPQTQTLNNLFCDLAEQTLAAGITFDPAATAFKQLFAAARDFPDLPAPAFPIPEMPTGLTMREALFFILTQPIVNPSFPTPGWLTAIGEYQPAKLRFVDESQLFALEPIANHYAAVATMADYSCALAGRRDFTGKLAAFKGAALLIGTERAFGPALRDTAKLFSGARSVTVNIAPDKGEQDNYLIKNRRTLVIDNLAWWIHRQFAASFGKDFLNPDNALTR